MVPDDDRPRDKGGRLIYTIDIGERIKALMYGELASVDSLSYSWDDGYERLEYRHKDGGSSHYAGVYHPEEGYCVGGGICIYCGCVLW